MSRFAVAPRALRARARDHMATRELPPAVRPFYAAALREARARGHRWAFEAATAPADVITVLELARGRRCVVELGTGPAWTTIALALADPGRRVVSYDPVVHEHREHYLALVEPGVRERIRFVQAPGCEPLAEPAAVDMVFVDSTHERAGTLAEFGAWRSRLRPGAVIAFHDYGHPDFPGVAEAIAELGLEGDVRGGVFVWRAP